MDFGVMGSVERKTAGRKTNEVEKMEKEENKELVMFVVSMSDTMGTLVPAPIEMDPIDENNNNECKSRWSACSELIRQMTEQLHGAHVDVAVAKNTDLGLIVTRGNSEDKREPIAQILHFFATPATNFRTNGRANPEFLMRELEKLENWEELEKEVHWFVDAETFAHFDPTPFLSTNCTNLTIYVVGRLATLHDNLAQCQQFISVWRQKMGANLKFLVSGADFEELKMEISTRKLRKIEEKTVNLFVADEMVEIQIQETLELGSTGSQFSTISLIGFICDLELRRLEQQLGAHCHVAPATEHAGHVLWTLAFHMLADGKKVMSGLCRAFDGDGDFEEFCLLVANIEESGGSLQMSLIRIGNFDLDAKIVDSIGQPSEALPDDSYLQFAPSDFKLIRNRLQTLENEQKVEKRQEMFDELCGEYSILDGEDEFLAHTEKWAAEFLN